ncbi:MAG: DUF2325 domain-containing protein [Azospirillaceae bacterium]|nr:DUF2325 domain-containing protein [Azospirillaceae bacterium]
MPQKTRSSKPRPEAAACADVDLCGRCILVVGGRHQHVAHLRRVVEACRGSFVHHDGGTEQSIARLCSLADRADAVLFPVKCVSHAAQDTVKKLCRRAEKPFVPLRSSGMETFIQALATLARPA